MRPLLFSSCRVFVKHNFPHPTVLPTRLLFSFAGKEKSEEKLVGTVAPHSCYILLHHHLTPSQLPSRPDSPLLKALRQRVSTFGALVNFAWREDLAIISRNASQLSKENGTEAVEEYTATAFSVRGGQLDVPMISESNLDEVAKVLARHTTDEPVEGLSVNSNSGDEVHLYVCTHGTRDCRCGETGGATVQALREELLRLRSQELSSQQKAEWRISPEQIKIGEVTHVGGHKYAANILVFPHGDWLGYIKPEDAQLVLQTILTLPRPDFNPITRFHHDVPPILPAHWRGRMGLTPMRQEQLLLPSCAS